MTDQNHPEQATSWAQPPVAVPHRVHGAPQAGDEEPTLAVAFGPSPARTFIPTVTVCPRCGGHIDFDGYCQSCGAKAPNVRDHFEQAPSSWVAGSCDRGLRHRQNEDALALDSSPETGGRAVLVVCDGVSTSLESGRASLAAARAAVDHLVGADDWNWDLADLAPQSATRRLLGEAAQAANQAVLDCSTADEVNPASCTLAIGVVSGRQLLSATVGDSRVYWLADHGASMLLSTDDSMAQEHIALGLPREVAESGAHAHVITRWLGRDAPEVAPGLVHTLAEGPGWLLVCSDGLWNYASDPQAMGWLVAQLGARAAAAGQSTDPLALARALVDWANEQGGHDNITVALARVELPAAGPAAASDKASAVGYDLPTTRTRPVGSDGATPAR